MKRLKKQLSKQQGSDVDTGCDVYPSTFMLPAEYHMFVEMFKKTKDSAWIMKPVGRAQGKGIFLFSKLSDIIEWKKDTRFKPTKEGEERAEKYIVQRYIPNPLLIGGKKFDLRIYVLVTSYSPLKVWTYREGFARFSGTRFSMDKKDIANNFIHLTNVAIQKTAEGYDKSKGCKWLFSRVKQYLISKFGAGAVDTMLEGVNNVIVKSLQSVQPVMINDPHCFEVYGYDILLDATLKPWLIEVNASPSLSADTKDDYNLKFGLLEDTFAVVELGKRGVDKNLRRVGGYDLLWLDGPQTAGGDDPDLLGATAIPTGTLGSHIGDRKQQLNTVLELKKKEHRAHSGCKAAAAAGRPKT